MIWYVAAGGALGSMSRYALGIFLNNRMGLEFPWITLLINVLGSFLLGLFIRLAFPSLDITPEVRLLLTTGFCGGFTTFSAFSYENIMLLQQGQYSRAILYIIGSVVLSTVAMLIGLTTATRYGAS